MQCGRIATQSLCTSGQKLHQRKMNDTRQNFSMHATTYVLVRVSVPNSVCQSPKRLPGRDVSTVPSSAVSSPAFHNPRAGFSQLHDMIGARNAWPMAELDLISAEHARHSLQHLTPFALCLSPPANQWSRRQQPPSCAHPN